MEDEFFLSLDGDFAAVFDGHGGNSVSRYLRKNLYANVQAFLPVVAPSSTIIAATTSVEVTSGMSDVNEEWSNQTKLSTTPRVGPSVKDYEDAFESAFEKVDREVQRISHWSYQGSTAVAIWIHEDQYCENNATEPVSKRTIVAANIGDSRAVLSRNKTAWELTRDHKPNDPYEQARIEELGGEVIWCGDTDRLGDPIPERGIYRVNGNLALSRAIGDRSERPHVTADPEIISVEVEPGDEFVVLATDGLWDVMESQEAVDFVVSLQQDGHDDEKIASFMVEEALQRGTYDNITVVIIWINRHRQG